MVIGLDEDPAAIDLARKATGGVDVLGLHIAVAARNDDRPDAQSRAVSGAD